MNTLTTGQIVALSLAAIVILLLTFIVVRWIWRKTRTMTPTKRKFLLFGTLAVLILLVGIFTTATVANWYKNYRQVTTVTSSNSSVPSKSPKESKIVPVQPTPAIPPLSQTEVTPGGQKPSGPDPGLFLQPSVPSPAPQLTPKEREIAPKSNAQPEIYRLILRPGKNSPTYTSAGYTIQLGPVDKSLCRSVDIQLDPGTRQERWIHLRPIPAKPERYVDGDGNEVEPPKDGTFRLRLPPDYPNLPANPSEGVKFEVVKSPLASNSG